MREYNQGDSYMEYEEDGELEPNAEESNEDTKSRPGMLFGMPIKIVVLGGVALFAVVAGLLIFSLRDTGGGEDVVNEYQSVDTSQLQQVASTTTTETQQQTNDGFYYDEKQGMWVQGGDSSTSSTTTNKPADLSSISQEDQIRLRQLGYSGDEIAFALGNGFDVQGLIDEATALYDAEADAALRRMSDSASEEFRYIIENSYFGQPGYQFVSLQDLPITDIVYHYGSFVVNADYVKCPTYGAQLQLKCKVAEDLEVFYVVTPERFAELPDTGNIVIEVSYTVYGEVTYVTDIVEPDNTVNPIDNSAVSTEQLQQEAAESSNISAPAEGSTESEDTAGESTTSE